MTTTITQEQHEAEMERHKKVAAWTGIEDVDLTQVIYTQKEIEHMVKLGEEDESLITIEAAQVRATLLLTTQVQRIADALTLPAQTAARPMVHFDESVLSATLKDLMKDTK